MLCFAGQGGYEDAVRHTEPICSSCVTAVPHKRRDTVGEVAGAEPLRENPLASRRQTEQNRTSTLSNSTIIQSIGYVCRLIVISPTVSRRFLRLCRQKV